MIVLWRKERRNADKACERCDLTGLGSRAQPLPIWQDAPEADPGPPLSQSLRRVGHHELVWLAVSPSHRADQPVLATWYYSVLIRCVFSSLFSNNTAGAIRTATKRAGGTVRNHGGSPGKRLGVKKFSGESENSYTACFRSHSATLRPGSHSRKHHCPPARDDLPPWATRTSRNSAHRKKSQY
jgi:hypothetical protein